MAKQRESKESKKIVDALNARGHFVWKNHGSAFSKRGLADITGFSKSHGVGIYLEVKRKTEKYGLTYQQFLLIKSVREHCGNVRCGVVSSVEEAIQVVELNETQTVEWWRSIAELPR